MSQQTTFDVLNEDPEIRSQRFALVSIVGPSFRQKADIYGLKIRGVTETKKEAVKMSERLHKIDPDFDIYTVDVGKFFPLEVKPADVSDVKYGDKRLDNLVGEYLKEKEKAQEKWQQIKKENMDAIRKQNTTEEVPEREHPNALIQRIKTLEMEIKERQESLNTATALFASETYTDAERDSATEFFDKLMTAVAQG